MRTARREASQDETVERIETLRTEKGISQKKMMEDLGLNSNCLTTWKYENSKPFLGYLHPIADYPGVTVRYLLTGDDPDTSLSDPETTLVKLSRKITRQQQEAVKA